MQAMVTDPRIGPVALNNLEACMLISAVRSSRSSHCDCACGRSSDPGSPLIKGQRGTAPPWPLG